MVHIKIKRKDNGLDKMHPKHTESTIKRVDAFSSVLHQKYFLYGGHQNGHFYV